MNKLLKCFLISERRAALVFERDLDSFPTIELLGENAPKVISSHYPQNSFVIEKISYYTDESKAYFVLNKNNFPNLDTSKDADYYVCGSFNNWQEAIGKPEWKLVRNPDKAYWQVAVPLNIFNDKRRKYFFKFADSFGRWLEPKTDSPNIEYDSSSNANLRFIAGRAGKSIVLINFEDDFDLSELVQVRTPSLSYDTVVVDTKFMALKLDSKHKLGASVGANKTTFKIFAPHASAVKVQWRKDESSPYSQAEMSKLDASTWACSVDENLHGYLYSYVVSGQNKDAFTLFDESKKITDPFACAMIRSSGEGFIIDEANLPKPSNFNPPHWHDLTIVETHLRDVLKNAQIGAEENKLKFKGLAEYLKSPDCYLRNCGANCVELMPVNEYMYDNHAEYQWGYMSVNWFSMASAYATNPQKFSQIQEFADCVEAFHNAGLAVILDVVYNHVGEPNSLIHIDKQYFFETTSDGHLINFSGCGNDFRANTPVGKKIIIESLKFMVQTYGVDGFRFDLAELLGVEVLKEIEVELKKIKPSIILIAEPWSFRGHIARALKDTGFASWNDSFREFAKDFVFDKGNLDGFKYFLAGSLGGQANWPSQSVNYIESHDDMCYLDRISQNPNDPSVDDIRRYKMAYAFALLSLGIPMLAEGFDLLRTKGGLNNTYLNGDANALSYSRGMRYTGLCDWLRSFVKFRLGKAGGALRRDGNVSAGFFKFFTGNSNAIGVLYNADSSLGVKKIFAAFNPSIYEQNLNLESLNLPSFKQIADIDRFDESGLKTALLKQTGSTLKLPALNISLWLER